jgi:hypothetical protein
LVSPDRENAFDCNAAKGVSGHHYSPRGGLARDGQGHEGTVAPITISAESSRQSLSNNAEWQLF